MRNNDNSRSITNGSTRSFFAISNGTGRNSLLQPVQLLGSVGGSILCFDLVYPQGKSGQGMRDTHQSLLAAAGTMSRRSIADFSPLKFETAGRGQSMFFAAQVPMQRSGAIRMRPDPRPD
jgi:hypothetical protein